MKRVLLLLVIALAAAAVSWWLFFRRPAEGETSRYDFVEVERGDLESLVSATGTLAALETVEVGTQVSGTIAEVRADYNDHVRKGQLLAVIDPALLDAAVRDAEAGVAKAEAQLEEAETERAQNEPLFAEGLISRQQILPLRTAVTTARATLASARTALDRAKRNRTYAEIRSPIDGVVIARHVDPGQTVAASFSTPTLFTIAQDLGRMEILAQVDESDIGQVRVGQAVRFTVPAYPETSFAGTVREVRLQPETIQNVVSYTVVVDAANPEGRLLPGMTATADFVVQQVAGALKVPAAALRLRPTPEMIAVLKAQRKDAGGAAAGGRAGRPGTPEGDGGGPPAAGAETGRSGATPAGFGGRSTGVGGRPADFAVLWTVDAAGTLTPIPVRTGASDGFETVVTPLRGGLEPGTQVISGIPGGATGAAPAGGSRSGLRRLGF